MITLQQLIDDYESPNTKTRKERRKKTQEYYTPYSIVKKMMDKITSEDWADTKKTFLEPSFGHGNFIIGILYCRIVEYGIDWKTTLETLYGVELMEDNVNETKERIIDLLDKLKVKYDKNTAYEIMNRNLVCSDFFKWNFEEWRHYTEDELKNISKKK